MSSNRIHPRIKAEFLTKIQDNSGRHYETPSCNISQSGIMLRASQELFNSLLRDQIVRLNTTDPVEFDIQFAVTAKDRTPYAVAVRTRAIYVRRISQNHYEIGLRFLDLQSGAEHAIQHYILANLGTTPAQPSGRETERS